MKTTDFIVCGILIALTLGMGIAWILTKGSFIKYSGELSPQQLKLRARRSIIAGVFYIAISVIIAVTMVAINYKIKWLMITCFVFTLIFSIGFIVTTRLVYRRNR